MKRNMIIFAWFGVIILLIIMGVYKQYFTGKPTATPLPIPTSQSEPPRVEPPITPQPQIVEKNQGTTKQADTKPQDGKVPLDGDKSQPTTPNIKTESRKAKAQASITATNQISNDLIGRIVTIEGRVTSRRDHPDGHVFLRVNDGKGAIDVPLFAGAGIETDRLLANSLLRITGKVNEYQGTLQLVPRDSDDLRVIRYGQISKGDAGRIVNITGQIVSLRQRPDGHVFTTVKVNGSNQRVEIPIFSRLNYSNPELKQNAVVSVRGKVQFYEGKVEIVPNRSDDIKIIR